MADIMTALAMTACASARRAKKYTDEKFTELKENESSNPIKGYASGNPITIDDLSPTTSKIKVNVIGKQPPEAAAVMMLAETGEATPAATDNTLVNLVPYPYKDGTKKITEGITFNVNDDGSITVAGTSSTAVSFILYESENNLESFKTGEYYTIYKTIGDKCNLSVKYFDPNTSSFKIYLLGDGTSNIFPSNASGIQIILNVPAGKSIPNGETFYPMIVEGRNVPITEYVPPIGATSDGEDHTHIDANKDHLCDICGERLSACVDNDGDGFCDYCGASVHTCADNDKDHDCDICGKTMGVHADSNKDHLCDYCGASGFGVHADLDGDGVCDYCGGVISSGNTHTCADNDRDHRCDECGTILSECADNDGDGLCDACGKVLGSGSATVTITTSGKNLLRYPFDNSSVDKNGLSITDNGDGTITINGLCETSTFFSIKTKNDEYISFPHDVFFSGCPSGGGQEKYIVRLTNNETEETLFDSGNGVLIPKGFSFNEMYIRINAGFNCENLVFKPQIEFGTAATAFEQYKEGETRYCVPGESVELTPIYPTMVISADRDDIVLYTEYNIDLYKIIQDLKNAIIALGGII